MRARLEGWIAAARASAERRWWAIANRWAYPVAIAGCSLFFYTFTRWQVRHEDRLPATGPVIVIANHLHIIDPPIAISSTNRQLYVMAKRELFEVFFAGGYFRAMGTFPVNRFGADVGALRTARNLLRGGGALLMFPEGTRSRGGGMRPALPGAAMIALMARVPIVPMAITGSEAVRFPEIFWRWIRGTRPRITVDIGEPFTLPADLTADSAGAERAIDYMMRRVAALLPEAYRGAYGRQSEGIVVFARNEGGPAATLATSPASAARLAPPAAPDASTVAPPLED